MENFEKRDYIFFIELFANYDCEVNEKFTVKNLITAFSNIVQIRYSKNPQNYSSQEYNELINICLKTMVYIVKSIFEICEVILRTKEVSTILKFSLINIKTGEIYTDFIKLKENQALRLNFSRNKIKIFFKNTEKKVNNEKVSILTKRLY